MNGHVLEYTSVAGNNHMNGGVHGGYGHSGQMLSQGCQHLHHKLPNGLSLMNGSGSLFSTSHTHSHDGTLPHSTRDCEHSHPYHHHNVSHCFSLQLQIILNWNVVTLHLLSVIRVEGCTQLFLRLSHLTVWAAKISVTTTGKIKWFIE